LGFPKQQWGRFSILSFGLSIVLSQNRTYGAMHKPFAFAHRSDFIMQQDIFVMHSRIA